MENKKLGFNDTERFYAVHNDNNTADEIVPPGGFYPYFTVVTIGELFSSITTILNDTRYYAIQNHLESYSLHYLGYFLPHRWIYQRTRRSRQTLQNFGRRHELGNWVSIRKEPQKCDSSLDGK